MSYCAKIVQFPLLAKPAIIKMTNTESNDIFSVAYTIFAHYKSMEEKIYIKTPIGTLQVTMQRGEVSSISILHENSRRTTTTLAPFQEKIKTEIEEYFAGQRKEFTFPLKMNGSSFQLRVWEALRRIPYGSVATYGDIAKCIGSPKASRAVGMACNRNPILLAVPCHRVVGVGGKLTGFAVGIERKKYLLRLERILF